MQLTQLVAVSCIRKYISAYIYQQTTDIDNYFGPRDHLGERREPKRWPIFKIEEPLPSFFKATKP